MCAEFTVHISQGEIEKVLEEPLDGLTQWQGRVRVHDQAPVLTWAKSHWRLEERHFSLLPSGTPYATFNARLSSWNPTKEKVEPLFVKRTWRGPFSHSRCIVPLSGFVEPIYLGELAGSMAEFSQASGALLLAAGLLGSEVDPKTGEVYEGFALILHSPSPYVLEKGHHRQPLFLPPAAARAWVEADGRTAEERYEWLLRNTNQPQLIVKRARAMAPGWEKRVGTYRAKLAAEMEFQRRITSQS